MEETPPISSIRATASVTEVTGAREAGPVADMTSLYDHPDQQHAATPTPTP